MKRIAAITLALTLALPAAAHADFLTFWAAAKGDYFDGTGEAIGRFDNAVGFGLETGLEILFIDLWGEAKIMGTDQYRFSGNLGFDAAFGDDSRFTVGLFTGVLLFVYPEEGIETGLQLDNLTASEQQQLDTYLTQAGVTVDQINQQLGTYSEQEGQLGRLAAGWNIARLRLTLDQKIIPLLWIGLDLDVGYHIIFSGEEVSSAAKNNVVNKYARSKNLPKEAVDVLKRAVGAEELDDGEANGINFGAGVFVKLEL